MVTIIKEFVPPNDYRCRMAHADRFTLNKVSVILADNFCMARID